MYIVFLDLCNVDWSLFANVAGAIANVGLLILGIISVIYIYIQINQTKKITQADFILRINSNFFTEKTINLYFLIENDLLKYKQKINKVKNVDYHYFEIDKTRVKLFPHIDKYLKDNKIEFYTSSDIEHLILNNYEDLGIMQKSKQISIDHIEENFKTYILNTCNNIEIKKYIKYLRQKDPALYSFLAGLYNNFKSDISLNL